MPALKYFSVPLSVGVNTRDTPTSSASGFLEYGGFDTIREGSITSRDVRERLLTTTTEGVPSQLWTTRTLALGTSYLVMYCASNGKVWTSSNLTSYTALLTWATTQKIMQADVLGGKLWMTNGADTPQSWDMTSASTVVATVAAMPIGQYLKTYKNYCFVAKTSGNPSRVFFSSIKDPTTWPTNNFQDVAPNDGDTITGLYPTPEGLMIWKQHSVWMMVGDTFDSTNPQWRLINLNASSGAGSVTAGTTAGYLEGVGVIWVGRDNLYKWTGTQVVPIGNVLSPSVLRIPEQLTVTGYTTNDDGGSAYNNLKDAQAVVFRGRYYVTMYNAPGSDGRFLLEVDFKEQIAVVNSATVNGFMGMVVYSTTSGVDQLLVAASTIGGATTGFIYEYAIWRATNGTAANMTFEAGRAVTRFFDFGDITKLKSLRRAFAVFSLNNSNATLTMPLTFLPNGSTTNQVSVTLSHANGTALGLAASGIPYTAERLYRQEFELNMTVRELQIIIATSAASITNSALMISLHQLIIEYTTGAIHGGATL